MNNPLATLRPRYLRFRLWTMFVISLLGAAVLMLGCLVAAAWPVRGAGVTAEQANRQLRSYCRIPNNASNVYFRTNHFLAVVECELDERSFLDWCKARNWTPIAIDGENP